MPRAFDLSHLPPPEASCFACSQVVTLDRRARSGGRFRCPHCGSDNKVGPDGVGRPLRPGDAGHTMPAVRCLGCGTVNRLPLPIIRRGGYRCWSCGQLDRVPKTLRRRAHVGEGAVAALLTVLILVSFGYTIQRAIALGRTQGTILRALTEASLADVESSIQFDVTSLPPAGGGCPWQVTGEVTNVLKSRVTLYLQAEMYDGEQPFGRRVVMLQALRPGETRQFNILLVDPRCNRRLMFDVSVHGVS